MRIACLVASYNRRDTTVRALRALQSQVVPGVDVQLDLFLTDDGSADGTADAVARMWPGAIIRHGDGSLFWAKSMALAEQSAAATDPDYYLWLNDDTLLDPGALATLLRVSADHPQAIVFTLTRDPETGEFTYGGRNQLGDHPIRHGELHATTEANVHHGFDTFEGNCVLIPRAVHDAVGLIDDEFPHAYADTDYALRARAAGFPLLQAPGSIATCPANPPRTPADSWDAAWQTLQSPKGYPWAAQKRFLQRHGDWRWPAWLVAGQARHLVRLRTGR